MRAILVCTLLLAGAAVMAQEQSRALPPVEALVKARHHHGIPYEVAAQYGAEAVAPLREILSDPDARSYWAQAVWVLGVIATPEAVDALIAFEEGGVKGTADPPALQALLLVPQALGFAARDPDGRAFAYLAEALKPGSRELGWDGPGWEAGSRELLLAKLSANGLGLAGNEAGRKVLSDTRARLREESPKRLRFLQSNISEALQTSARIEKLGYARALAPNQRGDPGPPAPAPQE